jgi:nicotinate-nucleotide pyrophosphorylase (carboxylating)
VKPEAFAGLPDRTTTGPGCPGALCKGEATSVIEAAAEEAVRRALSEDMAGDDVTTRWSVPADLSVGAEVIVREPGVVAGLGVMREVYRQVDPDIELVAHVKDGERVEPGTKLASLGGRARSIVTGERAALNFLQRLGGIATLTSKYVETLAGTHVLLLDTRKTAPGLRALDKHAVTCGGGHNHRMDLAARVLLKENHIASAGGVCAAIDAVRTGMAREGRDLVIETEVRTVAEARDALDARIDWVMLDNMSLEDMRVVVAERDRRATHPQPRLEASGTISLRSVRRVAATGVDAISVGALTHSPAALDITMLVA